MAPPRIAVVLRGPAGVWNTETFRSIECLCRKVGESACFVNLDDHWGRGEMRRAPGAPAVRYADLVGRSASVLLVELSLAEPDWGATAEEGASRNPEWAGVLRDDRRDVKLFRLWAPWDVVNRRVSNRGGFNASLEIREAQYKKLERDEWQTAGKAKLDESVIQTAEISADAVAETILRAVLPGRMPQ